MMQIKAWIAGKASAPAHTPYLRPVGNGAPLSRAATQSWVILDVPNLLIYEDRPKRALAWTVLSKLAVDDYSGVWMPCHASARFGCVSHNHPSS